MKKVKSELNDWGRPEYKRADLGEPVLGKYAKRIRESTNVVVLDPKVAKASRLSARSKSKRVKQ